MKGSLTRGGSNVAGRRLGLSLLLVVTALALAPARAQAVSEKDKPALSPTVAAFIMATQTVDALLVIEVMPPGVMAVMAKSANVSVDEARQERLGPIKDVLGLVRVVSDVIDVARAEWRTVPPGRTYCLLGTAGTCSGLTRAVSRC